MKYSDKEFMDWLIAFGLWSIIIGLVVLMFIKLN